MDPGAMAELKSSASRFSELHASDSGLKRCGGPRALTNAPDYRLTATDNAWEAFRASEPLRVRRPGGTCPVRCELEMGYCS